MNEQALQQLYRLAKGEGYQKGYNDFKTLMATNEQAIGNMYEISRIEGYQKSIDDFKVLVGFDVKKKDDSQPTLETEVTTESTTGQVPGEDISSDSVFEYDLTETEKIKAEEEAKAKAGEYDFKPTEFDPSTLPKEPLVKDAYPGLFQGESAFTDRVADKLARKYNKAGENVEEVFPDMYKDVFEEVSDERKFVASYDELPEEVKTRIEPGVVRENGEVIGVNQSLIPNQNIEEIVKLYETEEIGDAGLQTGLIENFADVIENQKREDYSIKIKKVGQLQEDIKNTKEKIAQLQEQGNNLLADQLSIPLNETIEEYNNLLKESNEDGILINSLDIISENEDMLAPLSGVSSAASELVARTASALPVVFGTLASIAGKAGFMTSAQAKVVSQSLMQDALKLENEVRDFFPKDYRDKKMNFTGEVVGQIGFIVGSGIFLGGTPAVVAAGYTMSASEMYREATDSGLSHEDAMNLSMAYGAISAPLEMWGASRAIGAVEGKLLRKKILNEILESGAKGFTREAAEKAIKVSYKPILTETLKESLEEGFQEGTQFLLSKGLAEAYNATKDEDKPEFLKASIKSEEFWLQAWDNFLAGTVGGGIGGVSLNVAGGNIFVGNDYKAIEKMFTDPKQMAKVDAQLNSYRKTGKIETDEELQAAKEQVGIVSQAAAEVRNATKTNRITVGNQKQLFKLTAERISLQKETEGVTVPSLIADKKQRIEQLDKNIQDIIAGKVVQPLETQEPAPKVTTEGIEDAEVEEEVDEKVINETKRVDNIFNETNPEVAETLSDNLVRNKSSEFELSSIGQSIVDQATKAAVAIQRVAPNVRVVLHDTSKEYTDFGREGTRGSYDPATKTIHIDLSKANKRTVGHETFHSILLESIKSDVELQKLTDDMYKTVNRSLATNPFLKRKLRKFSEKYSDNIRSEEALSELFGMLSSDYKKLSAPVKIKIKQFVNKVATKFGLGDIIKLSEQDLSDIDTIDLLNTMATRVKEGEAIAEEETKPLTDRDVEEKVSDKQTDRKARGQLNETESNEVSKSVEDRTIKGKKVPTFLKFKEKDKVEFLSFEGEINQENVKEIAPQSYNTTASKLSTYNTFGIDKKAMLMESIEGASKKEINKKLNENKLIVDKAILKSKKEIDKIKGKKSLTREEKKVEINQQKEIINILRGIKKSKDLVNQFESVMSIEIKVLSDSLYNSMFYKLGPKLSKLKTKELLEKSDNIYSKAKEIVKSNLLSVYNSVSPSIRKISKLWYDGANLIAQEMSSSYDVTTEQAAAIIATQSPQMPWFDNLHLADVIMDTLRNRSEELFTQEMFDYYVLKSKDYPKQIKYIPTLKKQVGKKLNELSNYDAGIFIRVDYDLNISRKAPIRIPTGTAVKESQKGDSSFGGYPVIEKGVAVFRDGSINNISNQLGRANKVRNFYVNIVNPSDRRAVTIDTHAMAIALFKPLASNDIEVNFGPASFAFYADTYRELAEELGIEARALQSITWEAARAIFPASKKAQEGYKDSISKIWDKFSSKEQTLEQVQEQIYNQAKDPNITEWSDYINELKNEKTRENVSGRIIRFDGAKTSDKLGDVSKPDSRVSTSRRRPISDDKTTVTTRAVREQKDEVVYHGSPTPIEGGVLKRGQSGAIFLTPNRKYAEQYSMDKIGEVTEIKISEQKKEKLFDLRKPEHVEKLKEGFLKNNEELEIEYDTKEDALRGYDNAMRSMREASEGREGINDWSSGSQFIEAMENAGFEGALFAERPAGIVDENIVISYALFDKQIPIEKISSENDTTPAVREQKVDSKSFKNILSKITNITKIDLKEQIQIAKDLKKRARLTKKEKKILDDSLRDTLNELQGKGKLTTFQVKAVLRKFQNVDVFSTSQVESFVDYMTKVFADADYLAKIRDADSKLPKARNNIKKGKTGINEVGPLLSKLFRINPRLIPSQFLDKYLDIVGTLSKRKKELELDLESITKNAEEILNYMDSEFSKVNWLASGFEDYVAENKSKVKGKTFTEIVSLMKEDGAIDDSDAAIMKKYRSTISPTKKTTKTEKEIQEEKDELIVSIKENSKEKNPIFSTNEELKLAKQLKELINTKGIEELSVNELKTLLQVINNINQGLVTNNASELRIKLDSLKNTSPVKKSLFNATVGAIEKRYNKVKTGLLKFAGRKKNYIQRTLESNPLYYIDQVFGDGKTKDLFNSLIRGMAEGEQNFNYDIRKIYKKLDDASDAVRKSFKGSRNKLIESSAKQFFYMLELEYNSNKDKTKVKRASEYLEETINLAKVNKRDIDMLEKIREAYVVDGKVDMDKLYSSFNSAEKKSIKVAQEINQSLAPKALFVAGVIRGQKIDLLNNYVHHVVVNDKFDGEVIDDSHELMKSMNESLKPSTKAKSVIERQNVVTALNFDIYNSVKRGSKGTLLDFHLTVPIKTSRATLKETKKALEKDGSYESKKDIYEGLDSLMESTISNFIYNSVASSGNMIGEKGIARIAKIGYQRVLADTGRMTRELISNMSFIFNRGREEYYEGLKYRGVSSETTAEAMRNLGSLQTGRLFSDLGIKSRFSEKLFEDKLGVRGKENKSKIMDTLGIINYYSLNPLARGVDALADGIISKPDQIMSRPLWKGAFASTFKQETGESFPEDGFERIAANDQAFMSKYKNALEVATKRADDISIEAAASSGLFTGISRGKDASRKRDIGGMFFANFNNYMSTFLNYEYQSFRKGLMAAKGNGIISEKEGRQLMAAVSTRMFMYTFLSSVITKGLLGILRSILGYAEEEEEEDKNLLKEGAKSVIQTLIGLFLGRNFGNLTKGIQNTIIEGVNEKYLDFLRDGEYSKYKDSLGYPLAPKKKDYEDAKIADFIYTFSGPYGKALELGDKTVKVAEDILDPSKKADAKKREKQRLKRFVFFEIPAFFGYAPFAREIEKELNSYMYKDFRKGGKSKWIDVGPTEAEEKKAFKQIDPEAYKKIYGK
jgi:hypothetical protein